MAAIMRDGVAPLASAGYDTPRILGLTASFVNGSLKGIEKKRRGLEARMLSTLHSPTVSPHLELEDFIHVRWAIDSTQFETIADIRHKVIELLAQSPSMQKDVCRLLSRCEHVYSELGAEAMNYYLSVEIERDVLAKIQQLEEMSDKAAQNFATVLKSQLPEMRVARRMLITRLREGGVLPSHSPKLQRLLELIENNDGEARHRQIVFVEQVALVWPLAKQINDRLKGLVRCGTVAGVGSQSESERSRELDSFRAGVKTCLVATAALEEGIDVPECRYVYRFSHLPTTKAHIQGSGRARHKNAQVYYFENSPEVEVKREKHLTTVARNNILRLSKPELDEASVKMSVTVSDRHPYPFNSRPYVIGSVSDETPAGEVNVFNCKGLFNTFCSMALGKTVSPKRDLFVYLPSSATSSDQQRKVLIQVRYPTPHGWAVKSKDEFDSFWNGVDLSMVFDSERGANKTEREKEEMCWVYLVVIDLRDRGYLDAHNRLCSSPEVRWQIKRSCNLGGGVGSKDVSWFGV
eukprot:GHVN01005522.1.p1 GENE.GHVN01005522.1~~GHVN01005522.1.p1  ORF type:complete len:521 (+),score=116.62 GHVN01005522.1:622-2184(+)